MKETPHTPLLYALARFLVGCCKASITHLARGVKLKTAGSATVPILILKDDLTLMLVQRK